MESKILLILSIFLLSGCIFMSKKRKMEIYHDAFKSASYIKSVDNKSIRFKNLNDLLYPNIDEILSYKKTKHTSSNGITEKITYRDRTRATIFYNTISDNVPPKYHEELERFWKEIGEDLLNLIVLDKYNSTKPKHEKKSTILYRLKKTTRKYDRPVYYESHSLLFNGTVRLRDTITNEMQSLIKEEKLEAFKDLKYYISIRPHTGI